MVSPISPLPPSLQAEQPANEWINTTEGPTKGPYLCWNNTEWIRRLCKLAGRGSQRGVLITSAQNRQFWEFWLNQPNVRSIYPCLISTFKPVLCSMLMINFYAETSSSSNTLPFWDLEVVWSWGVRAPYQDPSTLHSIQMLPNTGIYSKSYDIGWQAVQLIDEHA